MRKSKIDLLLAGAVLTLAVAAPAFTAAAQERAESVVPLPPALDGQMQRHRAVAPVPPSPAREIHPAEAKPQASDDREAGMRSVVDRTFSASDTQIAEWLHAVVSKQIERRFDQPGERQAVLKFYVARNYAPLWITNSRLNGLAKTVIAHLKDAGADGLDPADYPVPDFSGGAEALAQDDIILTHSMLTFGRHLAVGRIAPTRVLAEVEYGNRPPEPADILRKVAGASDAGAALESFNPPHEGFRALKAKLAELRGGASRAEAAPNDYIADGHVIRPGAKDARVPELRARLHVRGKPGDLTYDRALYDAVRRLQYRHGMKPTGVIDRQTIAAINGPRPLSQSQKIDRIAANLERWRWLPRDLGKTYVMVNIPDYTLKVVHDHAVVWRTKIVAGKPQTPTPLLSASMDSVLVNPSWYVPQSIIQNELLPRYASDPNIFDRMGLEVKKGTDGNINVVQPPGAANALGRIKFNFPNKFQVYLHDTPEKNLFRADKRAFSHGCMRVEDPTKFGEVVLHLAMNGRTPDSRQLSAMFGQDEHTFKLNTRPMVHLTYQTAFVDDGGRLVLRDDIYGFDARINAIMHSGERRIADVAPPPDPNREVDTAKANQEILRRVERREANNPFVFFEQLFR